MAQPPRAPLSLDALREISRTHSCPVVRSLLWEIKRLRATESFARQVHQHITDNPPIKGMFTPPMNLVLDGLRAALGET